ncbi:MAG: hypothetical protein AAGA42_02470 [Actinomycetota bacterium]
MTIFEHRPHETPIGLVYCLPEFWIHGPPPPGVGDTVERIDEKWQGKGVPVMRLPEIVEERYRVVNTLPIVGPHFQRTEVREFVQVLRSGVRFVRRVDDKPASIARVELPDAVPGGTALIVEAA